MTDISVSRDWLNFNDEEYTDSLCFLLPKGQATLIDVEDFERVCRHKWQVMGRTVFFNERVGRYRVTMRQMSRYVIDWDRGFCESHNFRVRLHKSQVDHENRNPWDNRRRNLRLATASQNAMNKPKGKKKPTSRFKGVTKVKGRARWVSIVRWKGNVYYLGSFPQEVEAALAYNAFITAHCPEHGFLNAITLTPDLEPSSVPAPPKLRRVRKKVKPPKADHRVPRELLESLGIPLEDRRRETPRSVWRRRWR